MSETPGIIATALSGLREAWDGIYNAATGLGLGRENDFAVALDSRLPYESLRALYRGEPYARRAVDLPVVDAFAKGYEIRLPDGRDDYYSEAWTRERRRLRLRKLVPRTAQNARWSRGGYLLAITVDPATPDQPLDLTKLDRIDQFIPLTAGECTKYRRGTATGALNPDDTAPLDFSAPTHYTVSVGSTHLKSLLNGAPPKTWARVLSGEMPVHASRVIRCINGNLSLTESASYSEEGESVLEIMFRVLAQHASTDSAAATLATELRQHMVKIERLEAIKASNQADAFMDRMRLLKVGRSVAGMIILGKGEEFTTATGSVSGFDTLQATTQAALCAAVGMPETVFMCKVAGGLGSGAGMDSDVYVSLQRAVWNELLCDMLESIYLMVRAQRKGPYRGAKSDIAVEVVPRELRELGPKDRATLRLLTAQSDSIYMGAGTLPPEYVAERFTVAGGWTETMPAYNLEKWPQIPPQAKSGGTPNKEGKNAPGQMPTMPGESVGTSKGSASGTSAEGYNPGAYAADDDTEDLEDS